ncbi:phosphatidylinositol 4-kinase, partial [Reticulomyxa filosa]
VKDVAMTSSAHSTNTSPKTSQQDISLHSVRGKSLLLGDPFGELWEDKKRDFFRKAFRNYPIGVCFYFIIYVQEIFKSFMTNDGNTQTDLQSVIFKSGEDMRQEQFAMQNIRLFQKIFQDAKLPLQLRPYSVVVTSPASGFVETVT